MITPNPVSQIFERDQVPVFKVSRWDTMFSGESEGLGFTLFDLPTDFEPDVPDGSGDLYDAEYRLNGFNSGAECVLGYDGEDNYRFGRIDNIYEYWGAGAPPGVSTGKWVGLHIYGIAKQAGASTLVLGGQGYVRVRVNGDTVIDGEIHEPSYNFDPTEDEQPLDKVLGYQYEQVNLQERDRIDIYYWQTGEDWGGLFVKLIPEARTRKYWDQNWRDFLYALQKAPVMSSQFFGVDATSSVPSTLVSYAQRARVTNETGGVPTFEFEVPLSAEEEGSGYRFDGASAVKRLLENGGSEEIRKGWRVRMEGGYRNPAGNEFYPATDQTAAQADETYPRFTGFVEDIVPKGDTALVRCRGILAQSSHEFDENYPDRLSYHANGFVNREWLGDPVYAIPAFDAWPLETAVADLLQRAGVDPYLLGYSPVEADPDSGRRELLTSTTERTFYGRRFFSADNLLGEPIRLERQPNYGNVGALKKEYLPNDDAYLFPPKVTERVYDRAATLAGHYGYDLGEHASGQIILGARNNPNSFEYVSTEVDRDLGHEAVDPSAVGGRYFVQEHIEGTWSKVIEGYFSRVDLYLGVGYDGEVNGGLIQVDVKVSDGAGGWTQVDGFPTTVSTWRMPRLDGTPNEAFYYDDALDSEGGNAAVKTLFSLPFDEYRVTLSPAGSDPQDANTTNCIYRINGAAVFERDPVASSYVQSLATDQNALEISPESGFEDLRNHVLVVGARKAVVTDSAKIERDENPNNPGSEFHVAVAVDPYSIYDPTADNFTGGKRMTVVFDNKVVDTDFANWLARTILFRYKKPSDSASIQHTALPVMELRDPIHVYERKNQSLNQTLWVQGFTEEWGNGEATVSIECAGYPEIPSFMPRIEVPIDDLFVYTNQDGETYGQPVVNVNISYKNLFGEEISNADLADPDIFTPVRVSEAISLTAGQQRVGESTSRVPMPDTLTLWQNYVPAGITRELRSLTNHPYRHFFHVEWDQINKVYDYDAEHRPLVTVDFQEGDGTAGVYDEAYYGFPSRGWVWKYMPFTKRVAGHTKNPFYDPYTSEVGNLVKFSFDALVSGQYRVSLWGNTAGQEVLVAWLTEPKASPQDEEQHWTYMEPGSNKVFTWDGVDNVGYWNRIQSLDFSFDVQKAFGEEPTVVGAGFYAWNDRTVGKRNGEFNTQIGDLRDENFDAEGNPYFTLGQYGKFYLRVEVLNDKILRETGERDPRDVTTEDLAPSWNDTNQAYVWTHLGEPTQVGIKIEDWDPTEGDWSVGTNADQFFVPEPGDLSTVDNDLVQKVGEIRNGKPVRITFHPVPRRGPLFDDDPNKVSVKLTRLTHLKATVFDQSWILSSQPWTDLHEDGHTGEKQKRLNNRMYHNEEHTLSWPDGEWQEGDTLSRLEWIFHPEFFRKDFGAGLEEALRYGDYEQLQSLGEWDPYIQENSLDKDRVHLLMAYLSYLFYFSAYTLDRSGRRQWCIHRYKDANGDIVGQIDKTKIVTPDWLQAEGDPDSPSYRPEYVINYERTGADRYLVRTMTARQWVEPEWGKAGSTEPLSPVYQHQITSPWELQFVQLPFKDLDPLTTPISDGDSTHADPWATAYRMTGNVGRDYVVDWIRRAVDEYNVNPSGIEDVQHGPVIPSHNVNYLPIKFGTWDFGRDGVGTTYLEQWFHPCPSRDFHPYLRYPYMPELVQGKPYRYLAEGDETYPHVYCSTGSHALWKDNLKRDHGAFSVWQGFVYNAAYKDSKQQGAFLGRTVQSWAQREARSAEVMQNIFDYVRQDELDRYETFRGVLSRDRYLQTDNSPTAFYGSVQGVKGGKEANIQPVEPINSPYFVNWARYGILHVGPIHHDQYNSVVHFVDGVEEYFDLRFRHAFVWYNSKYFPVNSRHGTMYSFHRHEYTGSLRDWNILYVDKPLVSGEVRFYDGGPLEYDTGAWVGWKDDIETSAWSADPVLRWGELLSYDERDGNTLAHFPHPSRTDWKKEAEAAAQFNFGAGRPMSVAAAESFSTGGLVNWRAWGSEDPTGAATGEFQSQGEFAEAQWYWQGYITPNDGTGDVSKDAIYTPWWVRTNILDDWKRPGYFRLAVGPAVPENRDIKINLTLPERLR